MGVSVSRIQQNKNEGLYSVGPPRPGQGFPCCNFPPDLKPCWCPDLYQFPSCPRWSRHCGTCGTCGTQPSSRSPWPRPSCSSPCSCPCLWCYCSCLWSPCSSLPCPCPCIWSSGSCLPRPCSTCSESPCIPCPCSEGPCIPCREGD